MLSQKQLENVCLLFCGNHKQCRYLEEDSRAWKWYCIKHKMSTKTVKDQTIERFLQDCKSKGIDPKSQGVALGNNCSGFPILKNINQGYDCP